MNRYAQINNGIVALVIESEADPDGTNGEWIPAGNAGPGWSYDPQTGTFSPPAVVPEQRFIFVGSFFDRFGVHKWPILADTNPMVQALVKDCQVRRYIDLDSPDLPAGLGMLVQAGHAIDPEQVIHAPVTEAERWTA